MSASNPPPGAAGRLGDKSPREPAGAPAAPSSNGGPDGVPSPTMQSNAARRLNAAPGTRPTVGTRKRGASRSQSRSPSRAIQDLWVARLKQGDTEALREVISAFQERLSAVVSGVLRDRDAVEDVVQETFVKAFYRIGKFKGTSSLYTWLYRVAVNGAKDYIKSRSRRPAASFDDLPSRGSIPDACPPILEDMTRRELRVTIHTAIGRLPLHFRTVLALREIEQMSYNEIAEALGLSIGTVESRLFRARKRLRAILARSSVAADHVQPGDTALEDDTSDARGTTS